MGQVLEKRLAAGLTIAELSEKTGISSQMITEIEIKESFLKWQTLQKLAAALNCKPHDIDDHLSKRSMRTCSICGQEFHCWPSSQNKTCGKPDCMRQQRVNVFKAVPNIKIARKICDESPICQANPEYHGAKTWVIQAPNGQIYKCRNLKYWLREHSDMIDGTVQQAWDGITKIKYYNQGKNKKPTYQWK
ncbi:MAG: helix-turn-helix transcriptional regulator, partial [Clostridiales bacterium]|nr:helix-turn-helix transcriptional regulator [Clostridiales bacterium]